MGTLYVVGLPVGDPEDVTLHALRVLREVSLIVAPAAWQVQELLNGYGIETPLIGCQEHDDAQDGGQAAVLEAFLQALADRDVALVAEAERPVVSGLAHRLVQTAVARGIPVASVPGPSAAVTALVLSGLPADAFVSLGYLPQSAAGRRALLISLAVERRTLVAFETSGRLPATLRDVAEILGDRTLALVRQQVEPERKVWRGTVREAMAYAGAGLLSGEWSLVVGGAANGEDRWPEAQVRAELARLLGEGLSRKAAARQVAEISGWRPREVYRLAR